MPTFEKHNNDSLKTTELLGTIEYELQQKLQNSFIDNDKKIESFIQEKENIISEQIKDIELSVTEKEKNLFRLIAVLSLDFRTYNRNNELLSLRLCSNSIATATYILHQNRYILSQDVDIGRHPPYRQNHCSSFFRNSRPKIYCLDRD